MSDELKAKYLEIQSAFHAADNLIRALPEEHWDAACTMALKWALNSYLPVTAYFDGLLAYTISEDDPQFNENGNRIFMARFLDASELIVAGDAGLVA